jgi:Immunity protein 35
MLTKTEALELVAEKLRQMSTPDNPFVVADEGTIEKPYGWVFFYNSKKYLETREISYALAGNGPVIVNKHDATVEFFGTFKSTLEFIAEYESKLAECQKSE